MRTGRIARSSCGIVAAVIASAALAGCGSDDAALDPAGGSPTATASTSTATPTTSVTSTATPTTTPSSPATSIPPKPLPTCASVWVAGQRLPRSYRGCSQHGVDQKPKSHPCELSSPIIEFDNRFYATAGSKINEVPDLAHDSGFHSAVSACQA